MSMITAAAWVPKGYAAQFPTKYDIDDMELARISKFARLKLEDAKGELQHARSEDTATADAEQSDDEEDGGSDDESGVKLPRSKEEADDDLREYELDHYDSDEAADEGETMGMFGNPKSLLYHEPNEQDPYITMPEQEDDEREELQVLPTDNMVIAAKVEDEVPYLEIYVYVDGEDNLYVHHDIMLPAIPLCVEWLDVAVGTLVSGKPVDQAARANFAAVGTLDPDIELWNLDSVDCMYPSAILGAGGLEDDHDSEFLEKPRKKGKKRKKSKKPNDAYHVDAVLSLAANRHHRTLLASASADHTVKLWDLSTTACARSYNHHSDKVCSVAWHADETTVLLSGSYDHTVVAADMRAPEAQVLRWGVESDIETVRWDPHNPNHFFATTEAGMVHYHDVRTAPPTPEKSSPIWTLQAHESAVSSFDVNPTVPGFLASGSEDKLVKLWNIQASGPSMVVSRNLDVGRVFATIFAPDPEVGFHLAVAGSKGALQIWDTSTNPAVRGAFAHRMAPPKEDVAERLVGVEANSSDSDELSDEKDENLDEKSGQGWESMEEES